jgi:hypothetical protein
LKSLGLALVLCLFLTTIQYAIAAPYWGNLVVDIKKQERIEGEANDLVKIKIKLTNDDREEISIYYSNVVLTDSKNRQFSSSSYLRLDDGGFRVTEKDCPWEFALSLNPGISEETGFCYIVPKDPVEFTLNFYELTPDYCKRPSFGSCQEKSVRLNIPLPLSTQIQQKLPKQSESSISDVKLLQAKILELEQKIKSLEKQIQDLQKQLTTKDKKISELTKQILKDKKNKKTS